ncbi:transporter [Sulfuricystis thermophila]|uniref:transporter n=1 Tax=Sulfuricystis thermophila TaxID=2496847 RepID=UPI001035D870|nr:transporter [Sulfuricystis thermophila]
MKRLMISLLLSPTVALAHHGVAGVGAAALEGPGAPVESASSAVLPVGKTLLYAKLDHAKFKTYDPDPANPESDYANYWMLGLGHGFTPWFSAYFFVPYHVKIDEPGGLDSKGWADVSVMGQIGFKYDGGLKLVPAHESLDDMEDWHFTVFFGSTLPTGNANHRLADGTIDPGKAHGFGKPALSLGVTATKQLTRDITFNLEASTIRFREYRYDDGQTMKFGTENRLNLGLAQRLHSHAEHRLRLDGVLEAQYLQLGRDIENGAPAEATGGRMLYLMPGLRLYKDNMSFAFGIKKAVWTRLNESADQQGAEGKEKYRLVFSASYLF